MIGLLTPAVVDPATGYRFYNAEQLGRLNRIIALKDLGLTLLQVQAILDDKLDASELRGMLRLRRSQLEAQLTTDAARLSRVAARLRMIEEEGHMGTEDVVLKKVAPIRIAELSGTASGYGPEHITPVIGPLYLELFSRLEAANVAMTGAPIARYEPDPGESGEAVAVHAGVPITGGPHPHLDVPVVDLPAISSAATIVHHGPMDGVMRSLQILARWIEDNGYRPVGYHREVYLDYHPDKAEQGVTELQAAVVKS